MSTVIQASINPSSGEVKELPQGQPVVQSQAAPIEAAPQVEPEKAAPPAEAKKPDPMSKNFASLARKEKQLRQQMAKNKAKEQALLERETQIARFEELKHKNPIEAVQALGLTYEDLVKYQLAGTGQPTPELEIKGIKQQIQDYIQAQQQKEQQAVQAKQQADAKRTQQVLTGFKSQIAEFVKSKADTYEMVNFEDPEYATEVIYETVEDYFKKHKQLLPLEKATELFEEYLTEDAKRRSQAKKLGLKQAEAQPQKGQAPSGSNMMEKALNALSGPRPTLNNSMTSSTSPNIAAPRLEMDRMNRALAALDKK